MASETPAQAPITPFAGRLGGNQEFIVNRSDPSSAALLEQIPDAAPLIPWGKIADLRGFRERELWRAGVIEGIGTALLTFITAFIGISPNTPPPSSPPSTSAGVFGTPSFLGPLIGGLTSAIILTLFIYCFSPLSGAHLNPLITLATLFARITSLPRAVIYICFQIGGAAVGGLMLRASYDARDFKVGGCFVFTDQVSVKSMLAMEFMGSLTLLFLAFGVGLDPRQRAVFGPALAPALVGLSLGVVSFGLSFARSGSGGPSMNPARCFGVFVGSRFPRYYWYHWVAAIAAAVAHAMAYALIPPWEAGLTAEKAHANIEELREKIREEEHRVRGMVTGHGNQ